MKIITTDSFFLLNLSYIVNVEGSSVQSLSKNIFKIVQQKCNSKKKVSKIYHQTIDPKIGALNVEEKWVKDVYKLLPDILNMHSY